MASKYQKRHYEDMARILYKVRSMAPVTSPSTIELIHDEMVHMFGQDNPLFDELRFTEACGLVDA